MQTVWVRRDPQLSGHSTFTPRVWPTRAGDMLRNVRQFSAAMEKQNLCTQLVYTVQDKLLAVMLRSLTWALADYSVSNVSYEYRHWMRNTLKLLTVISFSIVVSPACIEGTTKAVSVSPDSYNNSFVSSYVTRICCWKTQCF